MCFWQNREVFSFPGRRGILYSWPSWQEFEREEKRLFSRLSVSFRTPATQAIVLVISHIRYTSWLKSYEAFWSFSYIWFGFLCAEVFFGNYEAIEWKFAILSLKPRSHVRILMYRKWTGCGGVALALLKKKQKANCGDKHEEMDLQPTINENVSSEKLYLL